MAEGCCYTHVKHPDGKVVQSAYEKCRACGKRHLVPLEQLINPTPKPGLMERMRELGYGEVIDDLTAGRLGYPPGRGTP
jgi:hypothetical protein